MERGERNNAKWLPHLGTWRFAPREEAKGSEATRYATLDRPLVKAENQRNAHRSPRGGTQRFGGGEFSDPAAEVVTVDEPRAEVAQEGKEEEEEEQRWRKRWRLMLRSERI